MAILRQSGFGDPDDPMLVGIPGARSGLSLEAAADAMGPGTIVVPMFQPQITDLVRKRGVLGQRIRTEPATGQPTRYFEQTRIVLGNFQNPNSLTFSPGNDPTRRERYATIKAIYGAIQFGLFQVELTRQQGQFGMLVAKDINDTVSGCLRTSDYGLWNGSDTNLIVPTTLEYMGILSQINRTASISSTVRIVDGLAAEVASLMAQINFDVMPTAIYVNPVLYDLINQEERLNQRQMPDVPLNHVVAGLVVKGIATAAGTLPLISDPFLVNGVTGASTSESGKTDYTAVIMTESLVEYHYVTSAEPRVYQLGLEGNLGTRYACVMFGAPVVKGNANAANAQNVAEGTTVTYAHSKVTVVR